MGRLDDKVAFITGAARGQGRSHAVRLAEEGAHIVAVDACGGPGQYPWMVYPSATEEDLAETARLVEATGRGIVARRADVRDLAGLNEAVTEGMDKFGRLDIVSANAGICPYGPATWENDGRQWTDVYEVNQLGVRNTCVATVPALLEGQRGGSIAITSSGAGLGGSPGLSDYVATKWAVIGFARSLAKEVGPAGIRVNVIAPGTVDTDMVQNDGIRKMFRPDLENPTKEDVAEAFTQMGHLGIPWIEPVDISNALVFLASDEARYITGVTLPVDCGMTI